MAEHRLRIAQVAPIAGPVKPDSRSSIEYLVWLLSEELVRRGHDVTLFATGDSQTSATLRSIYPRGYEHDDTLWDWEFHESMHMAAVFERADEFDVIHSHAYHYALPFTRLTRTPVVHTYHTLVDKDVAHGYARYPQANLVTVSEYQRSKLKDMIDVPVIYNGIDTGVFPFNTSPGDYLLFLGRMMPEKGPVEAIRVAQHAGMRLVLAGPGGDYFRERVEPMVDGRMVEYAGPVAVKERNELLANAAALVYPITCSETFGMVLVEAMACGTPVAALGRGAVPEIVQNGVTGYHAQDLDTLASHVPDVLALDRTKVRQSVEMRFSYKRMADSYLAEFRRLATGTMRKTA